MLHYAPADAGKVIGFFGIGALASIPCGWIGDRYSPKLVLSGSLLCIAVLGYLFFLPSPSMAIREILTCVYGVAGSAVLYVNLAGYHVKALRRSLSSKGSGMFVTSLYGGAAFGGYLLGGLANRGGWLQASEIQITLLSVAGGGAGAGAAAEGNVAVACAWNVGSGPRGSLAQEKCNRRRIQFVLNLGTFMRIKSFFSQAQIVYSSAMRSQYL